jgi:hypothetical protein
VKNGYRKVAFKKYWENLKHVKKIFTNFEKIPQVFQKPADNIFVRNKFVIKPLSYQGLLFCLRKGEAGRLLVLE